MRVSTDSMRATNARNWGVKGFSCLLYVGFWSSQFSNPNTSSIGTANFGLVTGTISSGTGVNGTGGGQTMVVGRL